MRAAIAALTAILAAACTPTAQTSAVQVATDLLTPAEQRCREAQDIAAGLTGTPEEMARWRVYVAAACLG